MKVAENASLRGEAIEVGSDEAFRAENADVCVALIVGEDDDDVGKRGAGGGGGGGLNAGEQEGEEQHDAKVKWVKSVKPQKSVKS